MLTGTDNLNYDWCREISTVLENVDLKTNKIRNWENYFSILYLFCLHGCRDRVQLSPLYLAISSHSYFYETMNAVT